MFYKRGSYSKTNTACQPGGKFEYMAKKIKEKRHRRWGYPPVNVQELDDHYQLFVYAAGYNKEDFQVEVKDNTLIITAKAAEKGETSESNWQRQEFTATGFQRLFELNSKIDQSAITAQYKDGILHVTLSKLEGFETKKQEIPIQ